MTENQTERTYGRVSTMSIWQRYLGAGCVVDETGKVCIPEKVQGSLYFRALDIDLYYYRGDDFLAFFEESSESIETKEATKTHAISVRLGAKCVVVQAPHPPADLYRVIVPDSRKLDEWALNLSLPMLNTRTGQRRTMTFPEFERWAEQLYGLKETE